MIGEVPAAGRSRVAGNQEAKRRPRKLYRLRAGDDAETVSMGIGFRTRILIAKSVGQGKARRHFPFVLGEECILSLVLVAGRFGIFTKPVRRAEQKVRKIVSRPDSGQSREVENPVGLVRVDR